MKDFLGRDVAPGDYFAYPLTIGRSACMALYQFVEVNEAGNVKAKKIDESYVSLWKTENKYKKFSYDEDTGLGKMVEVSPKQRAAIDAKLSTLLNFTARACKTDYTP